MTALQDLCKIARASLDEKGAVPTLVWEAIYEELDRTIDGLPKPAPLRPLIGETMNGKTP